MDLYPEGTFLARCKSWALTASKAGLPQVFLTFEDTTGRTISSFKSLSEKALPYTLKALRNCGWTGSDVTDFDKADCGLDRNQVEIVVEHEEYEGVKRAKVGFVNAPGAAISTLDPAKKASFAQALKASILALEMGKPAATSKPSGPPPGHPADADIPF